jgi:tetratricopeptide (TPR) repeat protein
MLWTLIKNLVGREAIAPAAPDGGALAKGIASLNAGDLVAACRYLDDASKADPDDSVAAYYLGLAHAQSGRLQPALTLLEASRARQDSAEVNNALGNVRRLLGELQPAAVHYRHALEIDENHLAALANLGLTLRDLGAPAEALTVLDRAIRIRPTHVETLFNQALAWNDLGEAGTAEKLIEQALAIDPAFAQAHLQRAFSLLKRRDFSNGWREYAWRVRIPEVDHWQDYPYPLWQGESLTGKRLLVQAEQGLGDQVMFASCLAEVLAKAEHVVIECDPRLAKLFARSFPRAAVYRHRVAGEPDWSHEAAPDFRARCGDLPRFLRQDDASFPLHDGYLVPDPTRVNVSRQQLDALGNGPKIGISWRGGTPATGQTIRSIALESLMPILGVRPAHFVSLQYGNVNAEVSALATRHNIVVHELVSANGDLDGVAALIANLDAVITVCTTAAHLAGALGKRTLVLVPAVAEWRYLAAGSSIPWYPSLRLFRQQRLYEWDDVISQIGRQFGARGSRQ